MAPWNQNYDLVGDMNDLFKDLHTRDLCDRV